MKGKERFGDVTLKISFREILAIPMNTFKTPRQIFVVFGKLVGIENQLTSYKSRLASSQNQCKLAKAIREGI